MAISEMLKIEEKNLIMTIYIFVAFKLKRPCRAYNKLKNKQINKKQIF